MNSEPVLIEDDDVDMESVVVIDEDNVVIGKKNYAMSAEETIILDDETQDGEELKKSQHYSTESEVKFVKNLKNNKLMNKIVTKCLNMENTVGMPRVINKSLLPLYRDTTNSFKESESLRKLLKKTFKKLERDPDHKFLHIKTLCEELKSGMLRKKVPFVTLANNLRNNSHLSNKELISSSREINKNEKEKTQPPKINEKRNHTKKKHKITGAVRVTRKKQLKKCITGNKESIVKSNTNSCTEIEKTDVIDLDNSENESVDSLQQNSDLSDVIVIEETDGKQNEKVKEIAQGVKEVDSATKETRPRHKVKRGLSVIKERKQNKLTNNIVCLEATETNKAQNGEVNKDMQCLNKTISVNEDTDRNVKQIKDCQVVLQDIIDQLVDKDVSNKDVKITDDPNKEYKGLGNIKGAIPDESKDYDLLIPKKYVDVLNVRETSRNPITDLDPIASIEKEIEYYKQRIDQLEQEEVTSETPLRSSYYLCSQLKKKVVDCYKKICQINGCCEEIVKRREIRLFVADGRPSEPAKRLEQFLNSRIDRTGTVPFPDFSDVVKCVFDSNELDSLGWNKQRVFQEASRLFQQCGQALRKKRQKREYRDLLTLVKNEEGIDDPAEKDPVLLAKLEENKRIAKLKEEEILNRYVEIERNTVLTNPAASMVEFESDSSESDNECEQHVILPRDITPASFHNRSGESSKSNPSVAPVNNLQLRPANDAIPNYLQINTQLGDGSKNSDILNDNVYLGTQRSSQNLFLVLNPSANLNNNVVVPVVCCNHCPIEESSHSINGMSRENCNVAATNCRNSIADSTRKDNETATHSESREANHRTCYVNDVQNNVSSTSDGSLTLNCDSSVKVKIEHSPLDIQRMLEELGDNFQCQVFDIEDPFIVIEISSDESTDEEL